MNHRHPLTPGSFRRQSGQGLVEYALILVLVAVVSIIILAALGPSVGNIFSSVRCSLNSSGGGCSTGNGSLNVTWNPPASYGVGTATATYTITYNGTPQSGVSLSCTSGFSGGSDGGGNYYVSGPRGASSTCTASYNGASTQFPVAFGA